MSDMDQDSSAHSAESAPATAAAASTTAVHPTKGSKRSLVGRVVSAKSKQTVTVLVERQVRHPLYGKYLTRSNKYHAHDESDALSEGDTVEIIEVRPISRTKTWRVVRLVASAQTA
jgi:small subunit ribosomal protein S17